MVKRGRPELYGGLYLCSISTQTTDAPVHQIAHTLIVDTHNLADVIILALLHEVEMDNLALTGRETVEILGDTGTECGLLLDVRCMVGFVFGYLTHAVVVDFIVAESHIASKLIVDAVAQGDIEITLNILNVAQVIALGEEFDKHIMDAIFDQLTVGRELHAESEKLVNILVI